MQTNLKYPLMCGDRYDTYNILELQNKILEIMVYIDAFCKEHEIVYYLMGGSALGAMRHKGFIPWDDDLDIFMDRKNYLKFLHCCKEHLDTKRFYLQKEDTEELPYFFSKLRYNGTTCIDSVNRNNMNMHQGIFVDIMCLNNAASSEVGKKIQYYSAGLLKAKALTKTNYKTTSTKKKIQLFFSKLFVVGPVKKYLLWIVRKNNGEKSKEVAHLFGRAKFQNSFYPSEDFCEQRYVPFENVKLAVPCGVERYLTIRYGPHYMEMPSEETKALYQSHAMIWDTKKDYREYLK